jgi:hypothetical protein
MTRYDLDWIVSLVAAVVVVVTSMLFAATLVAAHNRAQRELHQQWILPEVSPRLLPRPAKIEVA